MKIKGKSINGTPKSILLTKTFPVPLSKENAADLHNEQLTPSIIKLLQWHLKKIDLQINTMFHNID